ncbi:Macro domain protein [Natrialba magadii ATCC 43099]|uniref:Appr-1-p processing protein n=1 Tax=Natrialba magadii (strain ATCC 43099 / DSM 3394 / CCM 3739 / CIP 104546 / IAM 13178 / JCM 8861 / NBRC 102185 / NCIMB 2190 / MS3) TaxID=547559 RepID=D3STH5_NATMM|nr:macro domain-containing protein [Natrialba magadii]ADD07042.1 Macro domain protein [Natrialba magadii ATCC 43099]ELY28815.1 Appr-1-p processing protein [Natrialba magadii ATCC 43099]
MEFDVIQGDIAAQSADVLVNAAGTSLEMGSGVAGALRRRAGDELNDEAVEKGPIDLGEVAVTDAYDLDAEYVIHAAAMPHYGDGEATEESIRDATRNTLECADELECESLVLPALGCGVAGFELETGASIIGAELGTYEPETLSDVRFIAYSNEEYETLRAATGKAEQSEMNEEREADR